MTVAELIEKLQRLDPQLQVVFVDSTQGAIPVGSADHAAVASTRHWIKSERTLNRLGGPEGSYVVIDA